jgi:hypothetical protein
VVSLAETAGQVEPKWVVSLSRNDWSACPETAGQIGPKYALYAIAFRDGPIVGQGLRFVFLRSAFIDFAAPRSLSLIR